MPKKKVPAKRPVGRPRKPEGTTAHGRMVRITEEQHTMLKALCEHTGRNLSTEIYFALRKWLQDNGNGD